MQQKPFLIRLVFLWLFLIPALSLAQTKSAAQAERQTETIDSFVREKMQFNNIPGLSLAVVREGTIILAKGYGMANLELSTPANEKTCFVIYSITKTFTATATMILVEEGKLSLEDPIAKYLKDLPAIWNPVTIRQLLNHTSGIKNWGELPLKPADTTRDYTQAEVIKMVAAFPLDFPPGERWAYNETGYFLLGMLIEQVSGKTYEQFIALLSATAPVIVGRVAAGGIRRPQVPVRNLYSNFGRPVRLRRDGTVQAPREIARTVVDGLSADHPAVIK